MAINGACRTRPSSERLQYRRALDTDSINRWFEPIYHTIESNGVMHSIVPTPEVTTNIQQHPAQQRKLDGLLRINLHRDARGRYILPIALHRNGISVTLANHVFTGLVVCSNYGLWAVLQTVQVLSAQQQSMSDFV